jgi:hypothetical protein
MRMTRGLPSVWAALTVTFGADVTTAQTRAPAKPVPKPAPRPAARPAPKPPAKPPVRRAPVKPAPTWTTARGVGSRPFQPHGFAAARAPGKLLPRGGSRLGALAPSLGKLVPVGDIVKKLREELAKGQQLPGDPWIRDYEQWEDARKRGEQVPPIAPGELTENERKQFDALYGKTIVDDLKDYVPFVFDVVPDARKQSPEAKIELLYQYGCRRVSRLLPGYARIVVKRIVLSDSVDLVGDWDAPIPPEALPKAGGKPGDKKPSAAAKPYQPKEEIVEVCTVTHRQVEETLKRDLGLLAGAVQAGAAAAEGRELIEPLSGLAFLGALAGAAGPAPRAGAPSAPRAGAPATPRAGAPAAPRAGAPAAPRPPAGAASARPLEPDTDRPGGDYHTQSTADARACQALCTRDTRCRAFTFLKSGRTCFLKNNVPPPRRGQACCDSGVK